MKIRNKITGEVKEVSPQELSSYGLQSPLQSDTPSPITQAPQGASPVPAAAGQFAGSLLGSGGGPVGRMVGGSMGAGVGQEVAQAQAGQPGDPGAFLQTLGPIGMIARLAQKGIRGPNAEKSPTEKAMQTGAATGLTGEALGGLFKLLKPGAIDAGLDNLTKFFSKGGKTIPRDVIKTRFFNETLPKALQSSGEASEGVIKETGEKLMGERLTAHMPDVQELNFVRKQFNAVKDKGLREFLANDIARILREEQVKLAPATNVTIGAQKVARSLPKLISKLPLGLGDFLNEALKITGGGISSAGKTLSRFGLPPLMQSMVNKNNQ